ncbi:mucin-associated surface protein (MASP), partial [Trypanosoma cruzi]
LRRVLQRGCVISATFVGRLPVGSLRVAWRRTRMDPILCRGCSCGGAAGRRKAAERWTPEECGASSHEGWRQGIHCPVSCRVWCLFLLLLAFLDVAAVGEEFFLCVFFTPVWHPFLYRHLCVPAAPWRPLSFPFWGQLREGFKCHGVVRRAVRCFIVACYSCVHASPMLMTTTLM